MVLKDKKYDALIKNILQFSIFYKLMILFFFSPLLRFILKEYLSQVSVSIAFNQNMIDAVSYTHLDVYKRQILSFM